MTGRIMKQDEIIAECNNQIESLKGEKEDLENKISKLENTESKTTNQSSNSDVPYSTIIEATRKYVKSSLEVPESANFPIEIKINPAGETSKDFKIYNVSSYVNCKSMTGEKLRKPFVLKVGVDDNLNYKLIDLQI